jgi:hypothetical protein
MDISTTSFQIVILFYEAFRYGDGAKCLDYVGTNTE